jgi:hypothetical protein
MALRPSTVDVLLKLLEHADANELLVLMEAENVLALLRDDGWTDDDVRKALKEEKKLPGELLLGLFERGRTPAELLAVLGPKAIAAVEAERAKPAKTAESVSSAPSVPAMVASTPPSPKAFPLAAAPLARVGVGTGRAQVAGLVIILAAALVPSMLSIFDLNIALALLRLGVAPVLGLVALVGFLGGALATGPGGRRGVVALCGAVASVGGCAAVIGYALWMGRMGRTTLLRLEIAAICMIGMLPALALAALLGKPAAKGNDA